MAIDTGSQRIAYLMSRFPKITETFILREMDALADLGWWVVPFSLVRESKYVSHPGTEAFLRRAYFAREHVIATFFANILGFLRHPIRYLQLLASTCWWFRRSPGMLARSLVSFPVAIYWAKIIRDQRLNHIHAHFATHATYIAYIISRFTGIGYSFTAHAHDIYVDQTMLAEKIHRADLVVPISEYNRRLLVSIDPNAAEKIHVVYCGIDTQAFQPLPDASRETADGASSQPLCIVTVARMLPFKGQRFLVEACRLLRDRGIDFQCALIGDGPDRPALEQAIARAGLEDKVFCLGWLPSQQVAERVARADVMVLPSIVDTDGSTEGLPNVLMEALGCGVPVVSTTISGIPELVESGVNGLLVPPEDPGALADALAEMAADPVRRRAMGAAGRARVLSDFDLKTNAQKKAHLFAHLVSE